MAGVAGCGYSGFCRQVCRVIAIPPLQGIAVGAWVTFGTEHIRNSSSLSGLFTCCSGEILVVMARHTPVLVFLCPYTVSLNVRIFAVARRSFSMTVPAESVYPGVRYHHSTLPAGFALTQVLKVFLLPPGFHGLLCTHILVALITIRQVSCCRFTMAPVFKSLLKVGFRLDRAMAGLALQRSLAQPVAAKTGIHVRGGILFVIHHGFSQYTVPLLVITREGDTAFGYSAMGNPGMAFYAADPHGFMHIMGRQDAALPVF